MEQYRGVNISPETNEWNQLALARAREGRGTIAQLLAEKLAMESDRAGQPLAQISDQTDRENRLALAFVGRTEQLD